MLIPAHDQNLYPPQKHESYPMNRPAMSMHLSSRTTGDTKAKGRFVWLIHCRLAESCFLFSNCIRYQYSKIKSREQILVILTNIHLSSSEHTSLRSRQGHMTASGQWTVSTKDGSLRLRQGKAPVCVPQSFCFSVY